MRAQQFVAAWLLLNVSRDRMNGKRQTRPALSLIPRRIMGRLVDLSVLRRHTGNARHAITGRARTGTAVVENTAIPGAPSPHQASPSEGYLRQEVQSITVVIACYSSDRWDSACRAIRSVLNQSHPVELLVVVDYNDELFARLAAWCPENVTVLRNARARGASGARNTGVDAATTEFVAFLDDDATAEPTWLSELVAVMRVPRVVGAGGTVVPVWQGGRPKWFPDEFAWVVGATAPVPEQEPRRVRNVWSVNMLVRRGVFIQSGGFRDGFGKIGETSEPEDTDLCIRMSAASTGGEWRSVGGASVRHDVPAARGTPSFFFHRCWSEGRGKAALVAATGDREAALSAEKHYLRSVLPRGMASHLREAVTGDLFALSRAAIIVAGVASTGFAFALRCVVLRTRTVTDIANRSLGRSLLLSEAQQPVEARTRETLGFQPVRISEVEISQPLWHVPAIDERTGRRYGSTHLLVRLDTEPLGVVEIPLGQDGITPDQLAQVIWRELRAVIVERVRAAGLRPPETLSIAGLRLGVTPYLRKRAEVLATAPSISVVLCTRDPDEKIVQCLDSVDQQQYPDYEVVVVDNAPTNDAVAQLLTKRMSKVPLRRIVEPRPGVAWARNSGWRAATGQVVVYIDDDEIADPHWLAEIARGFRARPDVKGVTGMILPAALDTQEQEWFEQFGGHSKGRGFTPAVFDRASHAVQHPLYPLPPFGATGNLAIDRDVLSELGGFDVALGSGTPARGSEDTALICNFMLAGHTLVYQPSALVRHHHYDTFPGIANQLYGYGVGLTAFYMHAILRDPRRLFMLASLLPTAARDLLGHESPRTVHMRADYPAELERLQRNGMLVGPMAYLRSRWVQQRVRQSDRAPK